MGGSQSSTTTLNQLTQTLTTVAESTVQNCQVASSQTQSANISNTGFSLFGNYNVAQSTTISNKCWQDASLQSQLQNNLISAIQQATNASGGSIMPAFGNTSSAANTNLTNIVKNSVTLSNIQNNYTQIAQSQNVTLSNSGVQLVTSLNMTQGASVFAAATLKALDDAGVFTTIKNNLDQSATASNSLFNFGNLFGGLGGLSSYLYLFIFVVIAIVAYRLYESRQPTSVGTGY